MDIDFNIIGTHICFSALYNFDTSVVSVEVLQQIYEVVSIKYLCNHCNH